MDFVKPIIGNKHKFDMNFIQYFLKFDLAFNFSKNERPEFRLGRPKLKLLFNLCISKYYTIDSNSRNEINAQFLPRY